MICDCNSLELPTVSFVGGETQDFIFNVYYYKGKKPHSLSGCICDFSIVNCTNRRGVPICSKSMTVKHTEGGAFDNVLAVTLHPSETIDLEGKYIYQITLKDINGDAEIPKQGYLYITNNINKKFIKEDLK